MMLRQECMACGNDFLAEFEGTACPWCRQEAVETVEQVTLATVLAGEGDERAN